MKNKWLSLMILSLALTLFACQGNRVKENNKTGNLSMMKEPFGKADRKDVFLFTLKNDHGITVKITNYGGIITSILMKDNKGQTSDIVLGFDSLAPYLGTVPYFGAIVGRYANRIAKGMFSLEGKKYQLAMNNGNNSLHGGLKGFDKVVWDASEIQDTSQVGLVLNYLSKDGEEGYPGNLKVTVTYLLNNRDEFSTKIEAITDQPSPVNLTNHSYFNLTGAERDVLDHKLTIKANSFTPVNSELIPTGKILPVSGTPMDFTSPEMIGSRIARVEGGYDHNFVLNHKAGSEDLAAVIEEPLSGRIVEIYTTQPGIQFYSGNFLDGTITGKGHKVYQKHFGLCLETQHFPDSPNQPSFPGTILKPGEKFMETTRYKFSIR